MFWSGKGGDRPRHSGRFVIVNGERYDEQPPGERPLRGGGPGPYPGEFPGPVLDVYVNDDLITNLYEQDNPRNLSVELHDVYMRGIMRGRQDGYRIGHNDCFNGVWNYEIWGGPKPHYFEGLDVCVVGKGTGKGKGKELAAATKAAGKFGEGLHDASLQAQVAKAVVATIENAYKNPGHRSKNDVEFAYRVGHADCHIKASGTQTSPA